MSMAVSRAQILIVDDEAEIRTLLRKCFEREGFVVLEAADGAALRASIARHHVDLVTLDLSLGGEDGLELAREIRTTRNVPIIMITGKGDTIDRVVGLELGADDYIVKPFQLREVLARVRAVLRRYEAGEPSGPSAGDKHERYKFGDLVLDLTSRELCSTSGQRHNLTTAELNLLALFLRCPHRVLSRDSIMDRLKGHDWSPLDRSIDALVGRLRKKVEIDGGEPCLIKTVRGVGYVFAGDVKSI
jgi:two-component system, OmpR family, response regulator